MKKSVIQNTVILFTALGISKLIGAVLKIPLTNILGGMGMGYFSSAYSVLQPVYALTVSAFPTVITRLIAKSTAGGRMKNIRKIKSTALKLSALIGFFGTVLILVLTTPFAIYITNSPKSIPSMLIIAPSLFFSCIAAVYKGYYEGLCNMIPTAMSQVVEAVFKAVLGIILSYFTLMHTGSLPYAAAAAVLGITISELLGTLSLFLYSRLHSDGISEQELEYSPQPEPTMQILLHIFREAMPLTLGALALNLNSFIDLLTITSGINTAVSANTPYFLQHFTYGLQGGIEKADIGNFIYGCYTGIVSSLFGLIPSLSGMVCKSTLPNIASAWESNNIPQLSRNLSILARGSLVIACPLCFGMAALCEPLLTLLYSSKPAEVSVSVEPLFVLCVGGVLVTLAGVLFSIFQAIGRADLQIRLTLLGAAVKLGGNVALVRIPQLNIAGAVLATLLCYIVICVVGFSMLKKVLGFRLGLTPHLLKSTANALLCAVGAYFSYNYLFLSQGRVLRLLVAVAIGGGIYLALFLISDREFVRWLLKAIPRKKRI